MLDDFGARYDVVASGDVGLFGHGGKDGGNQTFRNHDGDSEAVLGGVFATDDGNKCEAHDKERRGNNKTVGKRKGVAEGDADADVDKEIGFEDEDELFEETLFIILEWSHIVKTKFFEERHLEVFGVTEHKAERERGDGTTVTEQFGNAVDNENESRGEEHGVLKFADAVHKGRPDDAAHGADNQSHENGSEDASQHRADADIAEFIAFDESQGNNDAENARDGGFEGKGYAGLDADTHTANEGNDNSRGSACHHGAKHHAGFQLKIDKEIGDKGNGGHGDDKGEESDLNHTAPITPYHVQLHVDAAVEEDEKKGERSQDWAYFVEVGRSDESKYRTDKNANEHEEQDIGDATAAEPRIEEVGTEDEETKEYICHDVLSVGRKGWRGSCLVAGG